MLATWREPKFIPLGKPQMPFIVEIDGYQLDMGDGFGQLAPDAQQKALTEAGEYIRARGPGKPQEAPAKPEAPKDTSFSSALQSGLDAPLEAIGDTATMLGAESVGGFLKGATNAPENYEPAQVVGDREKAWYDPRAYNFRELPRAAVEQLGQVGGSLATRAGGAAAGAAVGGPVGAVVGGFAGPALFEAAQVLGPAAKARAKNNNRETPNAEDWMAAATTAGASGALNAIIPDAKMLRPLVEALTESGQSVIQQTGETVGTEKGLSVDPYQAVGEGLSAGTSAGGIAAAKPVTQAANATIQAPFKFAKDARDTSVLRGEAAENPEQFASDARVQRSYDEEKAGIGGKAEDVQVFRNLWKRQKEAFKSTVEALHDSGDISPEQVDRLVKAEDSVLNMAGKHTQELSSVDLDAIETAFDGRDDEGSKAAKDALLATARDLNTTVKNAKFKNEVGPGETLGRHVRGLGLAGRAAAGFGLGGTTGAIAGAVLGAGADKAGRMFDKAFSLNKPEVLRRSRARAKLAEKMGVDTTTSLTKLSDVRSEAEGRADGVVILPKAYHEMTRRRKATDERREIERQAHEQAIKDRREAKRLEGEAKKVALEELAKAETIQKHATDAFVAAQRAEDDAKAKADTAERQLVDRGQRGAFQFQLSQAKARTLAAKKVADDAAKAAQVEKDRIAKEEARALKEAAKVAEKASKAENQASRAKEQADSSQADLDKAMKSAGSTAQRLGAPRLGGWIASTIEHGTKATGLQVDVRDVQEAVSEFVADGRLTQEQADQLFNVHGAQINKRTNPGLYYEVQDVAAMKAAQRNGVSLDPEGLKKAREKDELETVLRRDRINRERKKQRGDLDKADADKAKATRDARVTPEVKAKRSAAAKKAAETRKAKPKEDREAEPKTADAIRNRITYQATVDTAQKALSEAMRTAPKGLSHLATEVENAPSKADKKAIVEAAKLSHPEGLKWIETQLSALAGIGGIDKRLDTLKARKKVST